MAFGDPRLLRRLTPREVEGWMWYEQVEPFGELRADFRSAQVAAMVHNVAVKHEAQRTIDSFLLRFEEKKVAAPHVAPLTDAQREAQAATFLNCLALVLNAEDAEK